MLSEAAAPAPPLVDAAHADAPPPLPLKACLLSEGDVVLGRTLGEGTQGHVCEATWKGRPVAVKIMRESFPRHMLGRKGSGNLELMMENLEGASLPPGGREPPEAQRLALLRELSTFITCRHENLVQLFGWYVSAEGGHVCLVMELLPDTLARRGDQVDPVATLLALASALGYLHDRGLVHRDVKPENVMLDLRAGAIKLGDFGLVRALDRGALQRTASGSGGLLLAGGSGRGGSDRALQRSNSYPRVGLATVTAKGVRVGVTSNVATGSSGALADMGGLAMPQLPAQPPAHGKLTRRLTPLILGPTPPAVPLHESEAWPPPAMLPSASSSHAPPRPRLRRSMTPKTGSLVTMAPEVWASPEYGTAADIYSLGRLISYMKTLSWRWRGVAALDAMEEACTREDPSERPTAAMVAQSMRDAERAAAAERAAVKRRWGCLARFVPPNPAALPAKLLQSLQYGVARSAVLRPAWYLTRLGSGSGGAQRAAYESG